MHECLFDQIGLSQLYAVISQQDQAQLIFLGLT
jgi:hypothetical protein